MDNVFRFSEFVTVSRFSLRISIVCIDVLIFCVSMKQVLLSSLNRNLMVLVDIWIRGVVTGRRLFVDSEFRDLAADE